VQTLDGLLSAKISACTRALQHLTSLEMSIQRDAIQVGTMMWPEPLTIAARQEVKYHRDVELTLIGQACVILQCGAPEEQPLLNVLTFVTGGVGSLAPLRKVWDHVPTLAPILRQVC
jgi:hypothetical protein